MWCASKESSRSASLFRRRAATFELAIDVAVESGAGGLVFLFQKPATFLWVGVDAGGFAGVERVEGETITNVVPWRAVGDHAGNSASIRLEVARRADQLLISADGRPLATLDTPAGTWEGRYGFVVAPRDGLGATAFDNLTGERLP